MHDVRAEESPQRLGDETARASAGTYVAAPPNVTHGFRPIAPARFLNMHAPDAGFAARARGRVTAQL